MEVVKIRLQAQMHSLADPLEIPQYRNAGHAVYTIVREEGFAVLYRGVTLTALRQATNQGASACPYICDTSLQQGRRELHRVSGIKEICPSTTARPIRPADLPAHVDRSHIRCHGSIFQRTGRHDKDPYVVCNVLSFLPLTVGITRRITKGDVSCGHASDRANHENRIRHVATGGCTFFL